MNSLRKVIERFIENLGKQNKKTFGSNRIDCCNVNKKK